MKESIIFIVVQGYNFMREEIKNSNVINSLTGEIILQ